MMYKNPQIISDKNSWNVKILSYVIMTRSVLYFIAVIPRDSEEPKYNSDYTDWVREDTAWESR